MADLKHSGFYLALPPRNEKLASQLSGFIERTMRAHLERQEEEIRMALAENAKYHRGR